mmetsp:Transcript_38496/g.61683  ORF Transcript_38496/g.61683 Transcript_38496/m.61683 type:complete len:212 (-) Transcript_38496:176-811(-)
MIARSGFGVWSLHSATPPSPVGTPPMPRPARACAPYHARQCSTASIDFFIAAANMARSSELSGTGRAVSTAASASMLVTVTCRRADSGEVRATAAPITTPSAASGAVGRGGCRSAPPNADANVGDAFGFGLPPAATAAPSAANASAAPYALASASRTFSRCWNPHGSWEPGSRLSSPASPSSSRSFASFSIMLIQCASTCSLVLWFSEPSA